MPTTDTTCATTDATSPDSLLLKTEPAYAARDRAGALPANAQTPPHAAWAC
jgi:hypothetical protein